MLQENEQHNECTSVNKVAQMMLGEEIGRNSLPIDECPVDNEGHD